MLKKLKSIIVIVVFCLILTAIAPVAKAQAASKEKSIVAVLDGKEKYYAFKIKKGTKIRLTVKILNISGEPNGKVPAFGYCAANIEKGSLFQDIKKSKFQKGNTFIYTDWETDDYAYAYGLERGYFEFNLPDGVKHMKIKMTISTVDGTKSIKSFKKIKDYNKVFE